MNRLFASIALLAVLAVGRGAGAAEAVGWITHLDQQSDRVFLDDGRIFGVSEDINFSSLTDGVKVRIRYDTINGDKIATEILLAPEAPQSAAARRPGKVAPTCAGDQKVHVARHLLILPNPSC